MMFANTLFAGMTLSARFASETASWATVAATRAFVGGLCALALAWHTKAPLRTRSTSLSWARSLFGTVAMISTFYALSSRELAVGDAVTLFATSPLLIAALSPKVLGERTGAGLWAVLGVAFVGVALVAGPHLSLLSPAALAAFGAAVSSALAMMFLRKMRSPQDGSAPESAEAIALHFSMTSFAILAAIAIPGFRTPSPRDVGWLLLTGLSGGIAQLAMTRAYALTEAAKLGAVSYLGTVLSFVGAVAFLGERPDPTQLAGSLLVVGAGVALAWVSSRESRASSSPEVVPTAVVPR
jgi:drug/metabolite transporter (DMT)-like permease